jgi:regulator of replication initiation timing
MRSDANYAFMNVYPSGTAGNTATPITAMSWHSNGNVGIGTTNPAVGLDVQAGAAPLRLRNTAFAGYWQVGPESTNSFAIYNNSNVGVYLMNGQNAWSSTSDIRVKKNIEPLDGALEKLRRISGYTYNYKHESDQDPRHVGVIAQDVQAVLPEAVSEKEGVLAVRYTELIPLVINAFKEFAATAEKELAALRSDVNGLKGQSQNIAEMNQRLSKLEAENARLRASEEKKARELASVQKKAAEESQALKARLDQIERLIKAKK